MILKLHSQYGDFTQDRLLRLSESGLQIPGGNIKTSISPEIESFRLQR